MRENLIMRPTGENRKISDSPEKKSLSDLEWERHLDWARLSFDRLLSDTTRPELKAERDGDIARYRSEGRSEDEIKLQVLEDEYDRGNLAGFLGLRRDDATWKEIKEKNKEVALENKEREAKRERLYRQAQHRWEKELKKTEDEGKGSGDFSLPE